ncbi:MAG: prolipoprotein diacylglyceryl transferase [Mogibacterium sp.]|nr:prolipoprotein diacylglyceryl transferase [Mogibacterium sp.]
MQSPGSVAFTIFGIDIMWYGILIASGMILAIIISYVRAPRFGIEPDYILDMAIWTLPIGIVGARLYYVIFNYSLYQGDFLSILNTRNGGLAIHGGIIAGAITVIVICRIKKISCLNVGDLVLPSVALAQAIGRWGNFFNEEAFGAPTDLPWAIIINGQKVHPTFLYESLWCLMLFFLLSYIGKHRQFTGQVVCLYGILYSFERFFVEWLRTDSLMIGPFKQAQVLSLIAIIICAILYMYLKKCYNNIRTNNS